MTNFDVLLHTARLLNSTCKPWGLAGGWALDVFAGRISRAHSDIDAAIWREDQLDIRASLPNWHWSVADKGVYRSWPKDEFLKLPLHEIHTQHDNHELELLLMEKNGGEWIFRRDQRIVLDETKLFYSTSSGLPVVNPAVCLLFKAKQIRDKDQQDFVNVLPLLPHEERAWLRQALLIAHAEHPWLNEL